MILKNCWENKNNQKNIENKNHFQINHKMIEIRKVKTMNTIIVINI